MEQDKKATITRQTTLTTISNFSAARMSGIPTSKTPFQSRATFLNITLAIRPPGYAGTTSSRKTSQVHRILDHAVGVCFFKTNEKRIQQATTKSRHRAVEALTYCSLKPRYTLSKRHCFTNRLHKWISLHSDSSPTSLNLSSNSSCF